MTKISILLRFLRFGSLAFGGPVAQIGMLKHELVDEERWIPPERFGRVLGVYQVLPGPEAHELCVHFGMIKGGRIGGFLAGLGFMLPGLLLMLIASALYSNALNGAAMNPAGLTGGGFLAAASAGASPAALALVVRGGYRIGRSVLTHPALIFAGTLAAAAEILGIPFWSGLLAAGLIAESRSSKGRWIAVTGAVIAIGLGVLLWLGEEVSGPRLASSTGPVALGLVGMPSLLALFWIGLRGGLLTFGGAYTAIPFVRGLAVDGEQGFMSDAVFLDGFAIGSLLPAPLVIFATFVGYIGGGLPGALVITVGMFLPAFAFTLVGFDVIHKVVDAPRVHSFLDGVTAGVVGIVAVTVFKLGESALVDLRAWLAALAASAVVWLWKSPYSTPFAIGAGVAVALVLR